MFRPLSLFIGLRYAYSPKLDSFGRFVSWLSMIGIMLGTIGLIVILSVMNGFENVMQSRILQYIPQVQITNKDKKINITTYPKETISFHKSITAITPLITGEVMLQSAENITLSTLIGADPKEHDPIKNKMYAGSFDSLQPSSYNLILGVTLAEKLNVNIGNKVRIISPEISQITPIGKIPSQRIFNVSALFSVNRDIDQSIIYINMTDAAKLFRFPANTISSWRIYFDNPLKIDDYTSNLINEKNKTALNLEDWRSKRGELFQAIKMEKNVMGILISLIIIVAVLNIITSLSLLVMEKRNEIAILKTQGLKKRQILVIFIIQGASSGIIGTVLGAILGLLLTVNLNNLMFIFGFSLTGTGLPTLIDSAQIALIITASLLLSIISTLYPAFKAANIVPAEALRYE